MKFKCAIVTGASRGIGRSIAKALAKEGINVCINYFSSKEKAEELCRQINEDNGGRAMTFQADVSKLAEVQEMAKAVCEKFGGVDILVNNAGVDCPGIFQQQSDEEISRILDVNIKGMLNASKCVLPLMIEKKSGKIINISSVFGLSGASFEAVYSATKGAVIAFTKSLAKEVGPSGICVNALAPGYIDTDMNKYVDQNYITQIIEETPLCRIGSPEDVANFVCFLSSEKANFITGAIIPVTGGWQGWLGENMKGKIIVIEGTDGSGKATQAKLLFEFLKAKGEKAILQSFPNYESPSSGPVKLYLNGELGEHANDFTAYQSSVLFAVDRLCTMQKLNDFLENGGIVVLDRYVQSNMTHQAGKIANEKDRDAFLNWLNEFEFETLKLPKPDVVLFLDVPVEVSKCLANERKNLKAGTKKDIHENDKNHLENAYNAGKYVAKKFGWHVIPCTENGEIKSINEIHELIKKELGY